MQRSPPPFDEIHLTWLVFWILGRLIENPYTEEVLKWRCRFGGDVVVGGGGVGAGVEVLAYSEARIRIVQPKGYLLKSPKFEQGKESVDAHKLRCSCTFCLVTAHPSCHVHMSCDAALDYIILIYLKIDIMKISFLHLYTLCLNYIILESTILVLHII